VPPHPAPDLRFADHVSRYDGQDILRIGEACLPGGRITAVLGRSGTGKSTLLRAVAGLGAPGGEHGIAAGDGLPLAGRVAFMAQQDLLLPWRSVLANVGIGPALRGEPDDPDRARGLLADVGLAAHADRQPGVLSAGMRQRAALARTLFEDRPFVLLDEPFAALDALTRHELQALAAERLRGRTVMLVTHDIWEALRMADEVRVLAGWPAGLSAAYAVPGTAPRPLDEPTLAPLYRELLGRLSRPPAENMA
jgi:putative hydroxymethylpyrimidine transport system ATP-binding protein